MVTNLSVYPCSGSHRKLFAMEVERTTEESSRSVPPADDPLEKILPEIKKSEKRMENRLKQLEVDVQHSQQETVQKAAKRAKREKSFSFKKKGH